jgi:hypothetical protein
VNMKRKPSFLFVAIFALFLVAFVPMAVQRFDWVVTKRLTVQRGGSDFQSNIVVSVPTVGATTTPALLVNQVGQGRIVEFQDAGTTVWGINDGGDIEAGGGDIDLNGRDLIIDADGDTILGQTGSTDDQADVTLGGATGIFGVYTGNVKVGNGTPTVAQDGEDFYVEGQVEVDGELQADGAIDANSTSDFADTATFSKGSGNALVVSASGAIDANGDLDVDGTANLDDVDVDLSSSMNIDGHMLDVGTGSYSDADGDNDVGIAGDLEVDTGIYGDGALDIAGNSQMTGTLNVDGAVTLNSTLDVDGNLASGTGALTVTDNVLIDGQADAEQLVIQGNATQTSNPFVLEQSDGTDVITATNAGALYLASLLDVDGAVAFNSTLDVNGGLTDIGGGSYSTANGDNDLGIAGDLEVDGSTDLDGALGIAGATTAASDITVSSDATGGDAGARSQFIGMPAVKLAALGDLTNGSTESANYIDDDATGECTEVDAGTNLAVTDDATTYRVDTHALRLTFTDVVTDDGVSCNAGAQDDLSSDDSIGFWIYSDVAITSGDFNLVVDDSDGTDQTYDIGAVSAGVWTWKEMDISGCNGNCDTMDNINIIATSQGGTNLTAANVYLDGMWKWAIADEEALGVNLVQDGVLSVIALPTAAGTDNDMAALVEQTDYIVNYQSGNDVIVTVTDQSANGAIALVAYQ